MGKDIRGGKGVNGFRKEKEKGKVGREKLVWRRRGKREQ